jgi:hypothetical protein
MSVQRLISVSGFFAALIFVSMLPNRISPAAAGAEPTAIVLLYFRGSGLNDAVYLEWATATEFETAGFRLERSHNENGSYLALDNIGFIPAEGLGLEGAEYEAIDDTAVNGQLYWYKLVEIEWGGTYNRSDPISVMAGIATPTATATHTPVATATTGWTPTNTPLPTATTGSSSGPPAAATATATALATLPAMPTATTTPINAATPAATATPVAAFSTPTAVPMPATVQAGPTRPALTPTAAGAAVLSQPPATAVAESGYPAPERPAEGEAPPAPGELAPPASAAQATTSEVIEQVISAPPRADVVDVKPVGGSDRQLLVSGEAPAEAPALAEATGNHSFAWLALGTALFFIMAGTVAVVFLHRGRRYEGSDRW